MHSIDLMDQPLIGNSRRERPEKTKLQILPRIERFVWMTDEISLPISVRFTELGNQFRTPPPAGLIHIPRHFDRHDLAELAGFNKLVSSLIRRRTSPLRSHRKHTVAALNGIANRLRVLHRVRKRLFDISVAARANRFNAMERVLEIRGANHDRLHIFIFVELFVVARERDLFARELGDVCGAFLASAIPNVREAHKFEIELRGRLQEGRNQAAANAIRESNNAHSDSIVGAKYSRVAGC